MAVLPLLALACIAGGTTCAEESTLAGHYSRYGFSREGDFELDFSGVGCVPDVNPEPWVNSIAVYKEDADDPDDLRLIAIGICPADADPIAAFESEGVDGCYLDLTTGTASDGEDLDVPDGGNWDGPCCCWVDERYRVRNDDYTARCEGEFRVVVETSTGAQAEHSYTQEFREGPLEDLGDVGCGCATVGAR